MSWNGHAWCNAPKRFESPMSVFFRERLKLSWNQYLIGNEHFLLREEAVQRDSLIWTVLHWSATNLEGFKFQGEIAAGSVASFSFQQARFVVSSGMFMVLCGERCFLWCSSLNIWCGLFFFLWSPLFSFSGHIGSKPRAFSATTGSNGDLQQVESRNGPHFYARGSVCDNYGAFVVMGGMSISLRFFCFLRYSCSVCRHGGMVRKFPRLLHLAGIRCRFRFHSTIWIRIGLFVVLCPSVVIVRSYRRGRVAQVVWKRWGVTVPRL